MTQPNKHDAGQRRNPEKHGGYTWNFTCNPILAPATANAKNRAPHDVSPQFTFSLFLVPPFAALLASPILRHQAQAESAGTPLTRLAGYKPEKKVVRQWDSKCATCHGEDGRGHTEQGKEMGIDDMTKAPY